jgi:hypothetical protein
VDKRSGGRLTRGAHKGVGVGTVVGTPGHACSIGRCGGLQWRVVERGKQCTMSGWAGCVSLGIELVRMGFCRDLPCPCGRGWHHGKGQSSG